MTVVQCSRRDLQKAQTRARIADAALELACRVGPDAMTVEDIAEAADVSPRTFFNYFPSKWDAVIDFDLAGHQEVADAIRARPADETPLEAIRHAVLEHMEVDDVDLDTMRARMRLVEEHDGLQRLFHGYFASFERQLVEAVAARVGVDPDDGGTYVPVLVASVMAAVRTTVWRYVEAPDDRSFADACADTFDVLAAGFSPSAPADPTPTTSV